MKTKRICLCLLFLALAVFSIHAQEHHRLKVAVVLSGGGAKGMGHIGVLKVLERAGIPIDYVVGTSMGSIVGGLYSIGYDANTLDSLVRVQDWTFMLSDRVSRTGQTIESREIQNTYFYTLPFGKQKLTSGGLIRGENLSNLFAKLTMGYHDSIDFNKLPIPFACVATNIVDFSEYDFHSGRLSTAMRASMSIPGAFVPVRIDGMVLVDGGLRNNYPADVARKMGADIVIGVSVQSDEQKTAAELRTGSDVLGQLIDVNCKNKYDENWNATDIPIRVNVKGYSTMSFNTSAIDSLIARGENAAMSHWDELTALKRKLGLASDYKPAKVKRYEQAGLPFKVKLTSVAFENFGESDKTFIKKRYRLVEGDSVTATQIETALTSVRRDLFYTDAAYSLQPEDDGYRLFIYAKEKKVSELNIGVRFDTEEMVALQGHAKFELNNAPLDVELTGRLGRRYMGRVDVTLNSAVLNKFKMSYMYRYNDINIYKKGERDYNLSYNYNMAELSLVNITGKNFLVDLFARYEWFSFTDMLSNAQSSIGSIDKNQHYISYHGRIHYNSQDREYFTRRGAKFVAEYGMFTDNFVKYNDNPPFSIVSGQWKIACRLGSRLVFQPQLYGRIIWGKDHPYCYYNVIGGQFFSHYLEQQMPFAGVRHIEYVDDSFLACQMKLQQRIMDNNYVSLIFAAGQQADRMRNIFDRSTLYGIQATYAYDSILGPLSGSIGYSNKSREFYFFIDLGFDF